MTAATERYRFADFKPYAVPDSLDELHGPDHGVITLPLTVYWGPITDGFDLGDPSDVITAYSNLLSNGDLDIQREQLNRGLLIRYWQDLSLDFRRVRPLWEQRFKELTELGGVMANEEYGSLTYVPSSDETTWSRRVLAHQLQPLRNVVFVDSASMLASRFRDAAKTQGLSASDIARQAHVDEATAGRMLEDGQVPLEDMLSIAAVLGLTVTKYPAYYLQTVP